MTDRRPAAGNRGVRCDDLSNDLLFRYALGALKEDVRAEVAGHLATCAACSDRLDGVRQAASGFPNFQRVPEAPAPRGDADEAVAAGPGAFRRDVPWGAIAALASAGVIVLGMAWYAGREGARAYNRDKKAKSVAALAQAPVVGDASGDGRVDAADAAIIARRVAAGEAPPPGADWDLNGDGRVDVVDALLAARKGKSR